jgi:prolipoprotein diacylglyceryltransferase
VEAGAHLLLRRDAGNLHGRRLVLALRLAKQDGIPSEQAGAIYMWTAVWAIVGARVLYVITEWHEFSNPVDISC